MNLQQIKQKLGMPSIDFVRGKDENNQPTPWLRCWDNERRVSVVAHEDVIAAIKADKNISTLALKTSEKATKTGDNAGIMYVEHILIKAASIEVSL